MLFSKGRFLPRVKKYFRENLGAPFVIGFQVLLLVCASLLIMGNSVLANEVAVYAYYLLVAGVVLQLFSFLRYEKGKKENDE
jgi:hypothetical protein